jgi:hypothetical protein
MNCVAKAGTLSAAISAVLMIVFFIKSSKYVFMFYRSLKRSIRKVYFIKIASK